RPDFRRLPGKTELLPHAGDLVVDFLPQRGALGEDRQIAVLFARVDERLGAVRPLLRRILRRVEPRAPGVAQDIAVLDRVAAAAHRPDDLVHVGRVDVLVDGDDPLRIVRAARHLRRERERLRGVTGVALLEAQDRHAEAAGARRMAVNALDAGNAEL